MLAEKYKGSISVSIKYVILLSLFCHALCRYTVMSGTPEKILEHLLETVKLDSNGNDAIGESRRLYSYRSLVLLTDYQG